MQFRHSILAFFLLAIYCLGFLHVNVPHCENSHGENSQGETHHHHEHHEHELGDNNDDGHIAHNDHLDDGLYDYIVCLVTDIEHESDGCNMHHCAKIDLREFSLKQSFESKFIAAKSNLLGFGFFETNSLEFVEGKETSGLPPILVNSPRRGPPFISC